MATVNLNRVYDTVTRMEGRKVSVNRAQVGEVLARFADYLQSRRSYWNAMGVVQAMLREAEGRSGKPQPPISTTVRPRRVVAKKKGAKKPAKAKASRKAVAA